MIQNIELKWLYDLIILEKYRNFTIASDIRNISQSSLSRRIQALESSLGFEVFDRETSHYSSQKRVSFCSTRQKFAR